MNIYQKHAKAIEKIGGLQKDATNPHAKSKYASLSNVLSHVNPVLRELGLLFTVTFTRHHSLPDQFIAVAKLIDIEKPGEQVLTFEYDIPFDSTQRNPVQGFGSTMTYGQRYIYAIVFNIPLDDEDPDSGKTSGANCEKNDVKKRKLTASEVANKWNGKVYNGKFVYIDSVKIEVDDEQLTKLLSHEKYHK